MGLRSGYRPPFAFPGIWLYPGDDESEFGVVHIIGVDPDDPSGLARYLGDKPMDAVAGTGTFDHIAFLANDWSAMRERCRAAGVRYSERTVPSLGLHQVFVVDPSGVTIELNYPASEAGMTPVHDSSDPKPVA
jgi:catechol 2,3-dioxygenase-like lactoylglutathione lyase family enzyme